MSSRGPSFIDKVNFIVDYWASDCGEDAFVYAETLLPCVLKAAGTYFIPSIKGVSKEALQQRLKRGTKHKGRKSKSRKFSPDGSDKEGRIPKLSADINEFVGKALGSTHLVDPIEVIGNTKFLFKLLGMANGVTNIVFISMLVGTAIYDWTSLLQQRCKDRGKGVDAPAGYGSGGWTLSSPGLLPAPPIAIIPTAKLPQNNGSPSRARWDTNGRVCFWIATMTFTGGGSQPTTVTVTAHKYNQNGQIIHSYPVGTCTCTLSQPGKICAQMSSGSESESISMEWDWGQSGGGASGRGNFFSIYLQPA